MRILIVGAGAVGGYYGGRLLEAGRDVTFLLREGRAQQLKQRGLRLISPLGDAVLQPAILTAAALRESGAIFDLILVSTKSYALAAAMDDFAPAAGPDTLILPLLNGMRHMDLLDERFGRERVLGGSVRIMAEVLPNGDVWQHNRLEELLFGFRPTMPANANRAAGVRAELTVPGFTVTEVADATSSMWQKWWMLAAIGATCILADGSLGDARRAPEGARLSWGVVEECMAVATANGYPPQAEFEQVTRERFDDPSSTITSSMYRDYKNGAEVEADQILGDLIRRAKDVPVPLLRAAYVRLKVYEERRRQSAQPSA